MTKGRKWTPTPQETKQIIKEYQAGDSSVVLGKRYGVHCSTILNFLHRHDVEIKEIPSYSRNFTDKEESEIARLYQSGWSARAIARMYGLKFHISIVDALGRQGIEQRSAAERNRLYQLNPNAFDSIDNEHAAYWLGFIYADGNVSKRSLTVAIKGADSHHLEKLKTFLMSEAIIKTYLNDAGNGKKYARATITITDQHLTERLQTLGISKGRPIPDDALDQIPDALFHHWLRGLFDGDGSAHKSPAISFCGDYHLMELVRAKIADHIGSNSDRAISKHKTAQLYYLQYGGRRIALRVSDYLYQDATIWLERKRQVITSWPEPKQLLRNEKGQYFLPSQTQD